LFLIRDKRRQIMASKELIARELESNAVAIGRYRSNNVGIQDAQDEISFDDWNEHKRTTHALIRSDRGLWEDVARAYEDLRRFKIRGADPPSCGDLQGLADRLREARY
jgi:hypothetical protein